MHRLTFAISADYARATGGYIYDQRILSGLEQLGWAVDRRDLPAGFPDPSNAAVETTAALFAGLPAGSILLLDQLNISVIPEVAADVGRRLRLAVIVHHPLADEGDRPAAEAERLRAAEREALRHARLVIATSNLTAATLRSDYGVAEDRLVVAFPGVDRPPLAPPRMPGQGGPVQLLSIGSVIPRKDHLTLIEALARCAEYDWHLTIVGDVERAPDWVSQVRAAVERHGFADRVTLTGALLPAAIEPLWRMADFYVAASRHEGFGMAVAEAVARGLPVVTTEAGAVGDWIDRRGAIVVPVGDRAALAEALTSVIGDRELRRRLAGGARAAISDLPDWQRSAGLISDRLQRLAS